MTNKVLKEIKKAFFRTKYRNGYKIVKILFLSFRFKSNHIPKTKLELHIPTKFEVVGRHTYCGKDLVVEPPHSKIGAFCSIGRRVVLGHGNHPLNYLSTSPCFYLDEFNYKNPDMPTHREWWSLEPIEIGNDVWIGDGVFVKNGVKIGDGAVLLTGIIVLILAITGKIKETGRQSGFIQSFNYKLLLFHRKTHITVLGGERHSVFRVSGDI